MDSVREEDLINDLVHAAMEVARDVGDGSKSVGDGMRAHRETVAAIMSAFKRASGVVVKELEWKLVQSHPAYENVGLCAGSEYEAVTPFGKYTIHTFEDRDNAAFFNHKIIDAGTRLLTLEAAKAACQADFAKRITSVVEPKNSADNLDCARSIQNGLGSAVAPSCVVTDAELEELEALLADCKCTGGTLDEAIHRKAQLAHWNASKGVRGQVITKWCSVEAHTVLATIEAFKVPFLISTIRELRAKEADTRAGYDADIQALCETLWKREPGCEFVRLNYPQIAAALEEVKP